MVHQVKADSEPEKSGIIESVFHSVEQGIAAEQASRRAGSAPAAPPKPKAPKPELRWKGGKRGAWGKPPFGNNGGLAHAHIKYSLRAPRRQVRHHEIKCVRTDGRYSSAPVCPGAVGVPSSFLRPSQGRREVICAFSLRAMR